MLYISALSRESFITTPRGFINNQIDEIDISRLKLSIIAQKLLFHPRPPHGKTSNFTHLLLVINTYTGRLSQQKGYLLLPVGRRQPHVVNLVWLPLGALLEFPINFLLLSELWVPYLLFSSPPPLFPQMLLAWIISTDCRHVWGWVSYSANSPRPALQGQISITSLALNVGRRPFR